LFGIGSAFMQVVSDKRELVGFEKFWGNRKEALMSGINYASGSFVLV
jgi:hypothetical protein